VYVFPPIISLCWKVLEFGNPQVQRAKTFQKIAIFFRFLFSLCYCDNLDGWKVWLRLGHKLISDSGNFTSVLTITSDKDC